MMCGISPEHYSSPFCPSCLTFIIARHRLLRNGIRPVLMLMEARIISIQLDQLVMLAFLDDLTLLDHQNPVRGTHSAQPMRDDEDGPALANLREVALDNGFGLVVQGAGRLIKDQHAGIRDQGARDGNPLPLPAG